eukprot:CAMPEP_0196998598 /NCGR_PEP_ID=MMETSP1380-20130617/3948_1 /TAXON_ID=5936 /ORGANISM="Euplotes crassus, Strain CT5" /LENGTH=357 /DNA_ID=CAMNT_0042415225 /DNA_START=658 /DNA_END=1731 /DNA_ORIENTATION=-
MRGSPEFESLKEDLKNWQNRKNQYLEWKKSHTLSNVSIGDKVDVRDTEYIWCTGSVERILKSKYNCADLYYVHYEGWSRCYDEYIPADSERIAPQNFYTSRTDIPKYTRHSGPDERIYGNVVEGGHDSPRNAQPENINDSNERPQNNSDPPQEQAEESQPPSVQPAREPPLRTQSNQTSNDEEDKDESEPQNTRRILTATISRPSTTSNRPTNSTIRRRLNILNTSIQRDRRNRESLSQNRRERRIEGTNRSSRSGLDELFSDFMGSYRNPSNQLQDSIIRSIQLRPSATNLQIMPISSSSRINSEGNERSNEERANSHPESTAVNEETQLSEIPEQPQLSSQASKNEATTKTSEKK